MSAADGDDVRRLPTGAHGIPPDVVARNQRERLVAAVAEAAAESGYAETTVADLTHRAGVSTATFYKLFADKRECALEAHRELLERLLEEVDRACAGEREEPARVRAGIHTALALLAADAPTARLLTVEVMSLGPAGAERNDAAIEAFAERLRAGREEGGDSSRPNAEWALVASISMLIGKLVMAGEAAGLPELEDELVAMATAAAA
jgi:AcrR family transcriptional regulator